ncbi:5-oxoprolinase subunit PxpA [Thalassotalea sp. LPB0316]|uniref:5-oxoprolinase subunit PxpA n=1 Tax=Thalassotalea sp. LPB0316 TaxID=2769490 RepID=UPI001868FD02|nr:5-oxoprolinase subunit PxpA [Thalassotalea sp. LPB0316]QOL26082.1 5-oxoprolinase subunit PxpA [Thalassotalea sp. LPB0316]
MLINCDLGESFGQWQMGQDDKIMPLIDMANIACGFHASDPLTLQKTLALAKQHGVAIGAHPSYPDLVGFGRRSMALESQELKAVVQYQIAAIQGMAKLQGLSVSYVKPHGALYNDMMNNPHIFESLCQAIEQFPEPLKLVIQALSNVSAFVEIAEKYQIPLLFEAFADRHYQDNGLLVPRTQPNAVINELDLIKQRCQQLKSTGRIYSVNNQPLNMNIDTLCIHGDNPSAVQMAQLIRQQLHG